MGQLGVLFRMAAKDMLATPARYQFSGCCARIINAGHKLDTSGALAARASEFFRDLYMPLEHEARARDSYWMRDTDDNYNFSRRNRYEIRNRRVLALLLCAEIADAEEAT